MSPVSASCTIHTGMQFILQLHGAGVEERLVPPDDTNRSLLWFQQDNITFNNVQLFNVDAFNVLYILGISGSDITLEGLESNGCNAQNASVHIQDAGMQISHSSFNSSPTRALQIIDSNVNIIESVFDGLSTSVSNGGAIRTYSTVDNYIVITDCSFRNNAATGLEDDQGYVSYALAWQEHLP